MGSNTIRRAGRWQADLFGSEKLRHEGQLERLCTQTHTKKKQDKHSGCLSALSSFNSGHHSSHAVLPGVVGQRRTSVGSLPGATPFTIPVPSNKAIHSPNKRMWALKVKAGQQ